MLVLFPFPELIALLLHRWHNAVEPLGTLGFFFLKPLRTDTSGKRFWVVLCEVPGLSPIDHKKKCLSSSSQKMLLYSF